MFVYALECDSTQKMSLENIDIGQKWLLYEMRMRILHIVYNGSTGLNHCVLGPMYKGVGFLGRNWISSGRTGLRLIGIVLKLIFTSNRNSGVFSKFA